MTGNEVYEKLAAMTPEERGKVCYSHPWPLSCVKEMLTDLAEFWKLDKRKVDRLLKNDRKLVELLQEAVDSDDAREWANDAVTDYLRVKFEKMFGIEYTKGGSLR